MVNVIRRIIARILTSFGVTADQLWSLLSPIGHSSHIRRHAAAVTLSRVRFVSALFAVLVPAWSVVDLLVFEMVQAVPLIALRFASAAVFVFLAWPRELSTTRPSLQAGLMLLIMLLVPPVFYLLSLQVVDPAELSGTQALVAGLYALMPTIVLGGLAVFPLTALEVVAFSIPAVTIALGSIIADHGMDLQADGAALWFMAMMMGLAMFSGMSQLHYMAPLVNKAMPAAPPGPSPRRSGTEALDLMFRLATLSGKPLSVAFFDLDHFKSINDSYGHEAGDKALQTLVESLRTTLRRGDILVRWGGEEFVAVLPDMPADAVPGLLSRLRAGNGLGLRPDGTALTASIGVAETLRDDVLDWPALVELADSRMYEAKRGGRDRAVLPGEEVIVLGESPDGVQDGGPNVGQVAEATATPA